MPSQPVIEDLGVSKFTGLFTVKWAASTDDVAVDHYILQMSDSLSFASILKEWTTTKTKQSVIGLAKGTYHFRVQAIDDEGLASIWSFTQSVEVKLAFLYTCLIAGGGLLLIVAVIVVVTVVVRRKKKTPTR
jgi:hypothetical protein